jgi:hypothetical protein
VNLDRLRSFRALAETLDQTSRSAPKGSEVALILKEKAGRRRHGSTIHNFQSSLKIVVRGSPGRTND